MSWIKIIIYSIQIFCLYMVFAFFMSIKDNASLFIFYSKIKNKFVVYIKGKKETLKKRTITMLDYIKSIFKIKK